MLWLHIQDFKIIQENESFLKRVIYVDECVFHVNKKVQNHISRIWELNALVRQKKQSEIDSEKVAVWCAMFVNQVFGPYYFGSTIIADKSYKQQLTNYLLPSLLGLHPDQYF